MSKHLPPLKLLTFRRMMSDSVMVNGIYLAKTKLASTMRRSPIWQQSELELVKYWKLILNP